MLTNGLQMQPGQMMPAPTDGVPDKRVFRVTGTTGALQGPFLLSVHYPDIIIVRQDSQEHVATFHIPYLRSYGQENGMFLFEAGRRCPLGPGRFSFAVEAGDNIFTALDADIVKHRQSQQAQPMQPAAPAVAPAAGLMNPMGMMNPQMMQMMMQMQLQNPAMFAQMMQMQQMTAQQPLLQQAPQVPQPTTSIVANPNDRYVVVKPGATTAPLPQQVAQQPPAQLPQQPQQPQQSQQPQQPPAQQLQAQPQITNRLSATQLAMTLSGPGMSDTESNDGDAVPGAARIDTGLPVLHEEDERTLQYSEIDTSKISAAPSRPAPKVTGSVEYGEIDHTKTEALNDALRGKKRSDKDSIKERGSKSPKAISRKLSGRSPTSERVTRHGSVSSEKTIKEEPQLDQEIDKLLADLDVTDRPEGGRRRRSSVISTNSNGQQQQAAASGSAANTSDYRQRTQSYKSAQTSTAVKASLPSSASTTSLGQIKAKALYSNNAEADCELSFKKGNILTVIEKCFRGNADWWYCELNGKQGAVPANYVKVVQ